VSRPSVRLPDAVRLSLRQRFIDSFMSARTTYLFPAIRIGLQQASAGSLLAAAATHSSSSSLSPGSRSPSPVRPCAPPPRLPPPSSRDPLLSGSRQPPQARAEEMRQDGRSSGYNPRPRPRLARPPARRPTRSNNSSAAFPEHLWHFLGPGIGWVPVVLRVPPARVRRPPDES